MTRPAPLLKVSARRKLLTAYAEEREIELIFFDPPETFDPAIVGLVYGYGQEMAVLYDEARILRSLASAGMSYEEAQEYFDFNTAGAYLGAATPRFLTRLAEGDLDDFRISPDATSHAAHRQRKESAQLDARSVRRRKRRSRLLRRDHQGQPRQHEVARQKVVALAQPQQALGDPMPFPFKPGGGATSDEKTVAKGPGKPNPFGKKFAKKKSQKSAPAQKALRRGGRI